MTLPERVVEVVHGTAFFELGTRDASLRPLATSVMGARIGPERDAVTCFLPQPAAERALANVKDNGLVALALGEPVSHESYQIKGRFRGAEPATPADMAIVGLWLEKAAGFLKTYGIPDTFFAGFTMPAIVALTFDVQELFAQTPGPGAGGKL